MIELVKNSSDWWTIEATHIQTHNQANQPDTVFLYGFPNQGIAAAETEVNAGKQADRQEAERRDCHAAGSGVSS